ncbi:hypothetical protein EXIGLDRAFT_591068, partial [Exidia glandulosa HHB12029]
PPSLQMTMDPELRQRFAEAYDDDPAFKGKGIDVDERSWYGGSKFYRGADGLLFFRDADCVPRLCVPLALRAFILQWGHEGPYETAHG